MVWLERWQLLLSQVKQKTDRIRPMTFSGFPTFSWPSPQQIRLTGCPSHTLLVKEQVMNKVINNYISVFKNFSNVGGRAGLREYWMFFAANFAACMILSVIDAMTGIPFWASCTSWSLWFPVSPFPFAGSTTAIELDGGCCSGAFRFLVLLACSY